jgi:SAM-dependent methyltransferase
MSSSLPNSGAAGAGAARTPLLAQIKRSVAYTRFKEWTKALRRRARLSSYRGSQYRCPICGVGLRAFKPIWQSYWIHSQQYEYKFSPLAMETFNVGAFSCPACDAYDRERLTALYLDQILPSLRGRRSIRLVEFAPAHALHRTISRYPFVEYRSADLFNKDVDDRIDLTDIAYPDESVDIFLCSHVLEHIEDDRTAMRELCRILTPGGFGMLLVPLFPGLDETHEDTAIDTLAERWRHFGGGDHVRQYGKRDFVQRLEAAGFEVAQLGIDHFGAEAFRKAGIAANSVLYVVRKQVRA